MAFAGIRSDIYDTAHKLIRRWKKTREETYVVDWDNYNMSIAWEASTRSSDAQTKVGAYLTTEDHIPLSIGYNGFPRKADDAILPNTRPEKYPWMIHAEINAVLNAALQGKSTKDSILYCTHRPCFNCTLMLWQAGCREIVFDNSTKTKLSDNEETEINLAVFDIVTYKKMICRGINFY